MPSRNAVLTLPGECDCDSAPLSQELPAGVRPSAPLLRILFISNLFPDVGEPYRGIHNAAVMQRLTEIAEIRVLSPRPVPVFRSCTHKNRFRMRAEDRQFQVQYPAVRYLPKFGSLCNHRFYEHDLRRVFVPLLGHFKPHIVLSAWLYPDGCAVAALCDQQQIPHILIAQGTDVHAYLNMKHRHRAILAAAARSAMIVTRSHNLQTRLQQAGIPEVKLQTIYNGVDLAQFCLQDRGDCRQHLELCEDSRIILFVGHLYPVKEPLGLVKAFDRVCRQVPNCKLIMIGAGALMDDIRRMATQLGRETRVILLGEQPQEKIAAYMAAADLLVVPSRNEGAPNVIREAFACGLPVVATAVGGIPELLTEPWLGKLVRPQDEEALAQSIVNQLNTRTVRRQIRQFAETHFAWSKTVKQYQEILQSAATR